jgi:7-cyano-7-deazaguanine synthase
MDGMRAYSTIVLLSGGIDSTLCGLIAARDEKEFAALSVYYGQHQAELDAAKAICGRYNWPHFQVSVTPFPGSLDPAGTNLILGRNTMFLSLAAAMLDPRIPSCVYIGANADDRADYPDCREEFFIAWENLYRSQRLPISIKRPLINLSKAQIVKEAKRRGVPLELTVSCYAGNSCGICNACKLRFAAGA